MEHSLSPQMIRRNWNFISTGIGTEVGNDGEKPVQAELVVDNNSDDPFTITLFN